MGDAIGSGRAAGDRGALYMAAAARSLLALASLCCLYCCRVCGVLSSRERSALVDMFHSLNGKKWRNGTGPSGRWLQGDPCEQRWYGVTCNVDNTHVTEFYPSQTHSGNALDGHIPPSIGNFSRLQHLVLSNAFTHTGTLKGTIPDSFASLTELQCVYFSHNRLSGTIPVGASRMTALQGVFMRDNKLSGSLPNVRAWRDLRSVDLDSNELTGDLSGFAQLPKLAVLIAHSLRLAGQLPPELCHVFQCDAHGNSWQCPLPPPPRNASKGEHCCMVDTCTNSSAAAVFRTALSAEVADSSSSTAWPDHRRQPSESGRGRSAQSTSSTGVGMGGERRLQADPGDKRPYGQGCKRSAGLACSLGRLCDCADARCALCGSLQITATATRPPRRETWRQRPMMLRALSSQGYV